MIYANFLFHELPADATRSVLKSVHKTLRPGGIVAIADVDVEVGILIKFLLKCRK